MVKQDFVIEYRSIKNVSFPSATAMKRYLESEAQIWSSFLKEVTAQNQLSNIPTRRGGTNSQALESAFDQLLKHLENPTQFNQATQKNRGGIAPPPPSETIEGQLILGLFELDRKWDAICAYVWFINHGLEISQNSNQPIGAMVARGAELSAGAYAAAALPFRRVTSQRLAGAARSAEAQVEALGSEVQKAQEINSEHKSKLVEWRDTCSDRAKKIENLIIRRERHRRDQHSSWIERIDGEVENRFERAEKRLAAVERANEKKQKER